VLEQVTVEGIEFYIKRITFPELVQIAINVSRSTEGASQLTAEQASCCLARVVILECVKEADGSPFFTAEDADKYFETPEFTNLIAGLFASCNQVNPCILKMLKQS